MSLEPIQPIYGPLHFIALCVGPVLHAGKAAVAKYALRNYRTWMLATSYAFSFGVELTVNNIIVGYISGQRQAHKYQVRSCPVHPAASLAGIVCQGSRQGCWASRVCRKQQGTLSHLPFPFLHGLPNCFCVASGPSMHHIPNKHALRPPSGTHAPKWQRPARLKINPTTHAGPADKFGKDMLA